MPPSVGGKSLVISSRRTDHEVYGHPGRATVPGGPTTPNWEAARMRRYLAELFATFIVVFVAAGAILADVFLTHTRLSDSFGPLGIIAAYRLAVAIAMAVVMPISGGHANPALTIAAYVARRLSALDTAAFVLAQLLGAISAAFLLKAIVPKDAFQF